MDQMFRDATSQEISRFLSFFFFISSFQAFYIAWNCAGLGYFQVFLTIASLISACLIGLHLWNHQKSQCAKLAHTRVLIY